MTHQLPPLVLLLVLCVAQSAAAQESGPVRYVLRPDDRVLEIEIGDLLADAELRAALDEGFPLRIQIRAALWSDGFIDRLVDEFDWRASARSDGPEGPYRLDVSLGDESHTTETLEDLASALARRLEVPLRPPDAGRYYYQWRMQVETLSPSDLQELERWLRGETSQPDSRNEGALSRGVRQILVRALGMPRRSIERRTRTFDWPD